MKIDYNPSKDFFDTREVRRFHYEYIEPLGWPRKAVELAPEAIVIRANRSGLLSLSARLVDVGLGRLNDLILEEVERPDRGIWSGDLEPGSPSIQFKRVNSVPGALDGFHYDSPNFVPGIFPPIDKRASFELRVEEDETGGFHVTLAANTDGFVALAKHSIYLAQADVPAGTRILYNKTQGLKAGSRLLVLENAAFPPNVPWAQPPNPIGKRQSQ